MKLKNKIKTTILSVAVMVFICSCVKESNSYSERKTYSGYVALEYTGEVIKEYADILTSVYLFNEYYSQPTIEKRDSVDRLYFRNTKIIREEGDTWSLSNIGYNYHRDILINTSGRTINDENAVWEIVLHASERVYRIEIERKENKNWVIKKHDNFNYNFEYSTEWDIKLNESGIVTINGKGSLLSTASPKLKLDYTITEPLQAIIEERRISIKSGTITILATDVNKKITEETIADFISSEYVNILYLNNEENWNYSIRWWLN